jgi:glyoxylase-like metal-dependent hydrolase (beta-lactamase superfamily II)
VIEESDLRELGIFRIPIPIPFPQAGGPINAYVLEGKHGLLLFDVGLGTAEARAALAGGFARAGLRFEDVDRIVLSHGHVDHYGAAAWVQEQAGRRVPVSIHLADAGMVVQSREARERWLVRLGAYLARLGVPGELLAKLWAAVSRDVELGQRLVEVEPLRHGDVLEGAHITLEVHHMPGHTPGLCCLYEPAQRLFFASDHLLEHVSPNPLIDVGPEGATGQFRPLVSYLVSIDRVRSMAIDLVLPGHAAPFTDHGKVIDSLMGFYRRRQRKLSAALRDGPLTVYEAMTKLFPSQRLSELFLMISETLGNLEVLEERGETRRVDDGEVVRFQLVG